MGESGPVTCRLVRGGVRRGERAAQDGEHQREDDPGLEVDAHAPRHRQRERASP